MKPVVRTEPPRWAPWLLASAPVIGVAAAGLGLVIGVLVVPLFDLTPWIVWPITRTAGHWEGASQRLLRATQVLAAIMMAHWVWAYAWLLFGSVFESGAHLEWFVSTAGSTWTFYLLEVATLMVLFVSACAASLVGLRRHSKDASVGDGGLVAARGDG